jgi:pyruvate dehydrogenase E2 component (dihydrolipoamide acetyltransferase)
MQEAKATIPHFYLTVDCEIDALMRMRKEINDNTDVKVSVNDFVIKAVALTLMKVPAANASFSEEAILRWKSADIAVAVALDDGLITPIIKGAEKKGVGAIAAEMKDLAARARAGKLKLQEFQGGTFSISNLGMYGIKDFAAVINPPHGGILAVGAGERRPVVKNGEIKIATVMSCTIACDHRVVDGATGAEWIQAFKKIIEAPALLAL